MPLTLYPAIDLKAGACVRLRRGDMADPTIYAADPAAQAAAFAAQGAQWLHVVDLDGAVAGRAENATAIAAILAAVRIPLQLGGGIRDMRGIEFWLAAGVRRVILGSAALADPGLVAQACRVWPGRVVVGIDARAGLVATDGWAKTSTTQAVDLAQRCQDDGAAAIIYTDIGRDGMLGGVNLDQTLDLAAHLWVPVIASGGIGSLADLLALKAASAGHVEGVIVGRALYEGRLSLPDALIALA